MALAKSNKTISTITLKQNKYFYMYYIFVRTPKTSLWRHFWNFLGLPDPSEFFQKSGSVSFLKLWLSNFKHKIKRHWWAVFEIFPWEWTEQTKERTNKRKASQIHWTLLLALVSNYLETQNGLSSMHFFLHFLFSWSNVAFFTLHAKQKSIYKWYLGVSLKLIYFSQRRVNLLAI